MNNKGQNILEYILLFTAVLLVMFAIVSRGGFYEQKLTNSLDLALNSLEKIGTENISD